MPFFVLSLTFIYIHIHKGFCKQAKIVHVTQNYMSRTVVGLLHNQEKLWSSFAPRTNEPTESRWGWAYTGTTRAVPGGGARTGRLGWFSPPSLKTWALKLPPGGQTLSPVCRRLTLKVASTQRGSKGEKPGENAPRGAWYSTRRNAPPEALPVSCRAPRCVSQCATCLTPHSLPVLRLRSHHPSPPRRSEVVASGTPPTPS